jgi:hypothetical protein
MLGDQFLDQDDKVQPEVKPDAATDFNIFIQDHFLFYIVNVFFKKVNFFIFFYFK